VARMRKLSSCGRASRLPTWARDWDNHYAWFIELSWKDDFDRKALEEMPSLKGKIGVPLERDVAKATIDRINRRSNQLRTYAQRSQPAPLLKT
jgi:hypothetical protein